MGVKKYAKKIMDDTQVTNTGVAVFGSINMDMVIRTRRIPFKGETIMGQSFRTCPGGKGANQAVAAAMSGTYTYMIGRVGNDSFGRELIEGLESYRVDISKMIVDSNAQSGVAIITIDEECENRIIVISGANGLVGNQDLSQLKDCIKNIRVLLLQLEIPIDMVIMAAKLAHENNVLVLLDPAPACQIPAKLFPYIDILTPNQSEAKILTGLEVNNQTQAYHAAKKLVEKGASQVILKMGDMGVYWFDGFDGCFLNAFRVKAVDTVAAGDAFNGVLASAISQGNSFDSALQWALAAGALCVTKQGAQEAMPSKEEIQNFLKS